MIPSQQATATVDLKEDTAIPGTFLNGYEVLNLSEVCWPVRVISIELKGQPASDDDRGRLKDIVWKLRGANKSHCPGLGFVIDIDKTRVAIPATWQIPLPVETSEYCAVLSCMMDADNESALGRTILAGILREAIKNTFKSQLLPELGPLWQDFDSFTQAPPAAGTGDHLFCRRFTAQVKQLRDRRMALQVVVGSTALDGKTFEQHYRDGTVAELVTMINIKRAGRMNRDNRPVSVRVVQQYLDGVTVKALDLDDIETVERDSKLRPEQQRVNAGRTIRCHQFGRPPIDVPGGELRLILDSHILGEDHRETIITPEERLVWMQRVRKLLDGVSVFGKTLRLNVNLLGVDEFGGISILPPIIRVRGENGKEVHIEPPSVFSEPGLLSRGRQRADHIRRNGFLELRPMNPLLAWPKHLGDERAKRMQAELDNICRGQGIRAAFAVTLYNTVEDIYQAVEKGKHDALLAVLPEGSSAPQDQGNMHEAIKRRIQIPSQCIQHNRTLPARLAKMSLKDAMKSDAQYVRRVRRMYEGCVSALLVKHHCFPFAPEEPFHYNLQVGLDVGGIHSSHVMACLGYGFTSPKSGLFFLPEEIPVEVQKKEPIPTNSLYVGLLALFGRVHNELTSIGRSPDFNSVLFYRDGQLLGDGDEWNERDALVRLHSELLSRGWISEDSTWTAVEVLKSAENWRFLRRDGIRTLNPIVGQVCFPFADPKTAIVATTGVPYLTQGTAQPLIARITDIRGQAKMDRVLRDLVWQADMCFTKVDMGMSLPWVLQVADQGALQLSRSYQITGITV
jgi:hypothetical protein